MNAGFRIQSRSLRHDTTITFPPQQGPAAAMWQGLPRPCLFRIVKMCDTWRG